LIKTTLGIINVAGLLCCGEKAENDQGEEKKRCLFHLYLNYLLRTDGTFIPYRSIQSVPEQ
jgi:hypothetical protein